MVCPLTQQFLWCPWEESLPAYASPGDRCHSSFHILQPRTGPADVGTHAGPWLLPSSMRSQGICSSGLQSSLPCLPSGRDAPYRAQRQHSAPVWERLEKAWGMKPGRGCLSPGKPGRSLDLAWGHSFTWVNIDMEWAGPWRQARQEQSRPQALETC